MNLGVIGRILKAILGPIPDGEAERHERAMMRRRNAAAKELIIALEQYQAPDDKTHPCVNGHD